MIWQDARWRWPLLVFGIIAGSMLAFVVQPGAASSPAGPGDQARLEVSDRADGTARVTLPEAEAGSTLRRVRWGFGAVAVSAVLLVAAIQYRAFRRLQDGRVSTPAAARRRRHTRDLSPGGGYTAPRPVVKAVGTARPGWSARMSLRPGIGD